MRALIHFHAAAGYQPQPFLSPFSARASFSLRLRAISPLAFQLCRPTLPQTNIIYRLPSPASGCKCAGPRGHGQTMKTASRSTRTNSPFAFTRSAHSERAPRRRGKWLVSIYRAPSRSCVPQGGQGDGARGRGTVYRVER